jgi:hypothetical protein
MPTREMNGPTFSVLLHETDREIVLVKFAVPDSKLGPVLVRLTHAQAEQLARELQAAVAF